MNTFECRTTTRSSWISDFIPHFMTHTVQFSSLYILWPEDGPAEGPKHVVSLIIKKTNIYSCVLTYLTSFPLSQLQSFITKTNKISNLSLVLYTEVTVLTEGMNSNYTELHIRSHKILCTNTKLQPI